MTFPTGNALRETRALAQASPQAAIPKVLNHSALCCEVGPFGSDRATLGNDATKTINPERVESLSAPTPVKTCCLRLLGKGIKWYC